MMKLLLICLLAVATAERLFHGDQVLRAYPTESQIELFRDFEKKYGIEFWTDLGVKRPVDFHARYITLNLIKQALEENNVQYEVFIDDVQNLLKNKLIDLEHHRCLLHHLTTTSITPGKRLMLG